MPRSSYGTDIYGFRHDPGIPDKPTCIACPYGGRCRGQCSVCLKEDYFRRKNEMRRKRDKLGYLERCTYGVRGCDGMKCSRCQDDVIRYGGYDYGYGADYKIRAPEYSPSPPRPRTAVERLRASVEETCRRAR